MTSEKTQSIANLGLLVAIVTAILAFILSIIAQQKSQNPNYPNQQIVAQQNELREIRRELREMRQKMQLDLIRQRFEFLRGDIEEGKNLDQVQKEITDIQQDLKITFKDANANTQQRIRELDRQLDRIRLQLRDNRADALQTIDTLLVEKLRQEI